MTAHERALGLLAVPAHLAPRSTLAVAGVVNRVRERLRRRSGRPALAGRYGGRPARVAGDLAANEARTWLLEAVVRRYGLGRIGRVVAWAPDNPVAGLRATGGVLATWHAGATITAIAPALSGQGLPALFFIHAGDPEPTPGIEFVRVGVDSRAALDRARERLAARGLVVVAVDGRRGSDTPPVTVLGETITFRRGAFALSRRSGRPVFPVAARWHRYRPALTVVVGDGLAPATNEPDDGSDVDLRMAESLGRWIEDFLSSAPERFRPDSFRSGVPG